MAYSAVTARAPAGIKKRFPWDGVKTNLGEIEEKDWCRLAEAVIERDGEAHLLKHLSNGVPNTIISGHQPPNCEKRPFSYTSTGF